VGFFHKGTLMNYSHIGWIPCINGHLDFGLMIPGIAGSFTNNSLKDPKVTSINYGSIYRDNHHARKIILQSKVDWKDNKNEDTNGDFRVILIAEANESNNLDERRLKGSLYIYPLSSEPTLDCGKSELPWFEPIHSANDSLNEYKNKKLGDWGETRDKLNINYLNLYQILNNNATNPIKEHFYKIDFEVNNNGLTKLSLGFSSIDDIHENEKYLLIRQAFYYVKYSLHSHKHHFSQEDSLTTVVPIETEPTLKCQTGLRLLGQLKRELTSIKRTYSNGGNRTFCDEQGIIAYMNSFCVSLRNDGYLTDKLYEREVEYLKSIKESFSVQTDKQDKKNSRTAEIKSIYRVYIAWGLSLISVVWLTTIKNFINYEQEAKIANSYSLSEHIVILIALLMASLYIYKKQVSYKIKNTLNTEGLICWIEQHYNIQDIEFKRIIFKKRAKATIIFSISMLFGFLSPSLV
jgi:hypothetical protein